MTQIWSALNVGDVYYFVNDPSLNVYIKCSSCSMCLIIDNGGTMDMGDRDNEPCYVYGPAASLMTL